MKKISIAVLLTLAILSTLLMPQAVGAAGEPALSVTLAQDTPTSQLILANSNNIVLTKINFRASAEESIDIYSLTVQRSGGKDVDFGKITLWDGTTQLGSASYLVEYGQNGSSATFNFPPEYRWKVPKGTIKILTVKADILAAATPNTAGAISGDAVKLGIDVAKIKATGESSGKTIIPEPATGTIYGNEMIIRKSKPIVASASLPSAILSSGEKTFYRWTVTANTKGDISWNSTIFEISGSINVNGKQYAIAADNFPLAEQGIYMSADDGENKKLIPAESLAVYGYNVKENSWNKIEGTFRVWNIAKNPLMVFKAVTNQTIAADRTQAYELRGNILYDGKAGDIIATRIPAGSIIPDEDNASFTWTDGIAWATDYLVTGIPTITLTLAKNGPIPEPTPTAATVLSFAAPETVKPGSDLAVAVIFLSTVNHLNAAQYILEFDPSVIQLQAVESGYITTLNHSGLDIPVSGQKQLAPGKHLIIQCLPLETPEVTGAGYLTQLKFKVIGAPKSETQLNLSQIILADWQTNQAIPVTCVPITIEVILPGDINGDGAVNILDCVKLLKIILKIEPPIPEADLNGDGITNSLDLIMLWSMIIEGE